MPRKCVISAVIAMVAFFGIGGIAFADSYTDSAAASPGGYFGNVAQQVGYVLHALGL